MKLTPKIVAESIKTFDVLCGTRKSQAEMAFISKEFFSELSPVFSANEWSVACSMVKRRCKWFPTIADFEAVREDAQRQCERNRPAPKHIAYEPDIYSEENATSAKDFFEEMKSKLAAKLDMPNSLRE